MMAYDKVSHGQSIWPNKTWKDQTQTAIIVFHEDSLRKKAATNYKLSYLNVEATGLCGRPHPILSGNSRCNESFAIIKNGLW